MSSEYSGKREDLRRIEQGEQLLHTCWGCGEEFVVTAESLKFRRFVCIACAYDLRDAKDHERIFPQLRIGLAGAEVSQAVEAKADK